MALKMSNTINYSKVDPSQYKDLFEDLASYDEAWGHDCEFQRGKW
jgi:hypothetical protein